MRADSIEHQVVAAVKEHVLNDETINKIADLVMDAKKKLEEQSELGLYEERLKQLRTEQSNIEKAIRLGVITETTTKMLTETEADIKAILIQISEAKRAIPAITREHVVFYLEHFKHGDIDDPAFRREMIKSFVKRVTLYDDHFDLSFDFFDDDTPPIKTPLESCSDNGNSGPPQASYPNLSMRGHTFVLSVRLL